MIALKYTGLAATLLFSLSLSGVSLAQEKAAPKIRLSDPAGADAAASSAEKDRAEKDRAEKDRADNSPAEEGSAEARPAEKPGTEATADEAPLADSAAASSEEPLVSETPESQVSSQPTPGFGPADPLPKKEPGADLPRSSAEPRVIDLSEGKEAGSEKVEAAPEPQIRGSELPFTYHMNHIDLALGFRVVGATSDGLEPFSYDPVFAEGYLRAGGAMSVTDRISVAITGEIGGGRTQAFVRDVPSQLNKTHLSVGVEGRYHFIHRMHAYARLAPGVEIVNATIGGDGSSLELQNPEKVGSPAFQLDGALGTALRLAGSSDGRQRSARLWVFAEGGYRVSGSHTLSLEVGEDGPSRGQAVELDPLRLSGAFFSGGLMMTF